ncbi:MAG TPA: hypothetical protein VJ776_08670, partial [Thermoanaerobaculia bacterium]|nr:hypothetical protein [Thermoanaerobaculia bacterium]
MRPLFGEACRGHEEHGNDGCRNTGHFSHNFTSTLEGRKNQATAGRMPLELGTSDPLAYPFRASSKLPRIRDQAVAGMGASVISWKRT